MSIIFFYEDVMFYTSRNRIKLNSRNEGKLKSYESCVDLRAWNHDGSKRDSYLRDWIKCDVIPIRVIPINFTSFSKSMTKKHRNNITPRCYPGCRSKVILENIHASCHAIKVCLKSDAELHKLLKEEEFETIHWPCERCVEILKNIKLFWKLILEKLFRINLSNSKEFEYTTAKSICEFAKDWKDEIVKQTLLVKTLSPLLSKHNGMDLQEGGDVELRNQQNKESKDNRCYKCDKNKKICKNKATITDSMTNIVKVKSVAKFSKDSSAYVEKSDALSNTCPIEDSSKKDISELQQKLSTLYNEIARLKNENIALKMKMANSSKDNISAYTYNPLPESNSILKPFEDCYKKKTELIKEIASEMIITLKKCANEDFQNVSIIQVLHKSNRLYKNESFNGLNDKNPLTILTKVHETFGTIVAREINIAQDNNCYLNDIKTSCYKL